MKRIAIFFTCFLILSLSSIAQYESRKGYAGISVGPSIAVRDFGMKDIKLETAGFANTGFNFNFNFALRIASNFGFGAKLCIQTNPFDEKALLSGLQKDGNINGRQLNFTAVDANTWAMISFMPGIFASIPIGTNGKVVVEPRANVGLMMAVSPYVKISWKEGGLSYWQEQENGVGAGFGYGFGGVIRFNLSDRTALLLGADYIKTKPKFFDVVYNYSNYNSDLGSFQQSIETVNANIGIAIRFKKDAPPIRRSLN
jgi:acetyltransferase-like isoleucine patch superfamily enzyme